METCFAHSLALVFMQRPWGIYPFLHVDIIWPNVWHSYQLDDVPHGLRRNHPTLRDVHEAGTAACSPSSVIPTSLVTITPSPLFLLYSTWLFFQGPQKKGADCKPHICGRKTRVDLKAKLFSLFSKPLGPVAMVVSERKYRLHKTSFNKTSQHRELWSTETFS